MFDALVQNIHHIPEVIKPAAELIPDAIHSAPAPQDAPAPQGK
ncbi:MULTISPECIES: hypothetical protein [Corynebacterium]|nr:MULTISPECIES: hypothetical protein [Corynebacterium]MDN8624937.1 hypothetical protein [Corynebacterium kroppenstedtii]MDU3196625.1 hypothetical protein [Corynebacterium kroppenstedtii]UWY22143.1 hypothetical protein N2K96_00375 [Corynebacterium kroppenstedtii]